MLASSKKQRHPSPPSNKSGGGRKSASGRTRIRRRSSCSFPYKLYQLLEDVSSGRKVCTMTKRKHPTKSTTVLGACVGWNYEAQGSFIIYDSDLFMEEVACDYFKMTKYRSFVSPGVRFQLSVFDISLIKVTLWYPYYTDPPGEPR